MTDPLDTVREHKPPVDWEWATTERGQQVMRRAMDLGALEARSLQTRPRRHSRGAIAAAVAGGAAVVTLGAFTYVSVFQVESPVQAGCYQSLDPQADVTIASVEDVAAVGAAQACVATWRRGSDTPDGAFRPVSCVNSAGYRGIFPAPTRTTSEQACAQIGWQVEES